MKINYQATAICSQKDSSAVSPEIMVGLTKGLVEALVYIQDANRQTRSYGSPEKKSPAK